MNNQLKNIIFEAHKDLKKNYRKYSKNGFNLSYSVESTWDLMTEIVILTLNPKSKKNLPYVPEYPFPSENDFFNKDKKFRLKKKVQGLIYDLYLIKNKLDCDVNPCDKAKIFSDKIILSSMVPFRTKSARDIKEKAWNYSDDTWKKIFAIYKPHIIIVFGQEAFNHITNLFNLQYGIKKINEKRLSEFCNFKIKRNYKLRYVQYNDVVIAGLPHPTGTRGYCGYHDNIKANDIRLSPVGKFLKEYIFL